MNKSHNVFSNLLAIIGPGLFLIGYNIGTGSVTTMASAGSRWGLSLTWVIVLSCIFTFICIWAFSKYTLTTGHTILYAIKTTFPFGKQIGFFIMCSIIVAEFAGITGLTVIAVDLLKEWISQLITINGSILTIVITFLLVSSLFIILWRGRYQTLEKILSILVMVMGISFLLTVFLVKPSIKAITNGMIPRIPDEPDSALIIAGIAGTTLSSAMLFCRSISLKAKGWNNSNNKRAFIDTVVSSGMMFLLSFAVMICAAGTLFVIGKPVENAIDMARTLEPLAGNLARIVFIIGLLGAGISSMIPTILIAPWIISDYSNTAIDPESNTSRIFVITGLVIASVSPFINEKPVFLMILTMALLAVILPLSTISITVLLNNKHMGEHRNSLIMNIACGGAVVFSCIMSYFGVIGLMEYFITK